MEDYHLEALLLKANSPDEIYKNDIFNELKSLNVQIYANKKTSKKFPLKRIVYFVILNVQSLAIKNISINEKNVKALVL